MGYTWGTYLVMKKDEEDGEPHSYGKYMNIWKKQPDGSWKAAVDMGNKSPLPQTP
jgi:ketosteroid isomerase-like protein